jgi:hypothetical protein
MADIFTEEERPVRTVSAPPRDGSIPGLFRSLADDVTQLFTQEVALARAEVGVAVRDLKAGVLSLAIGLGVLLAGIGFLLLSAVYALAMVVEPWLAALIVGGVVSLIGLILLLKAKKALDPKSMVPDRTIESLRRDQEMVKRSVA